MTTEKEIIWMGTAKEDLKALPADVVRQMGFNLAMAQQGVMPEDSKRIGVLHCFHKKSQKTGKKDLAIASNRLKDYKAYLKGLK